MRTLLTYFKQIAIHKLKVEKRTIKKLFTIYFDEKETTFKPIFFCDKVTMLFLLKKSIIYTKLKIFKKKGIKTNIKWKATKKNKKN